MNSTRARIGVIAACLGAGFCVVVLHLWFLMVQQHEIWARRSHENRWSFRSVPSQRGAIRDREGRVLVDDEPTMQLSLYYLRFRLYHAVGAAVHGATTWAGLQPGGEGTRYSYLDGALGPLAAAEHLLSMPASLLRPGHLPKDVVAELAGTVTTVLSVCSGIPRRNVYRALRTEGEANATLAVGDALPMPRVELLAAFARSLQSLQRFDAELQQAREDRAVRAGQPKDDAPTLLLILDDQRRASLEQRRSTRGSLVETVRRVCDDHVPFELAASLRIGAERHPGLEITPSIERICSVEPRTSLRSLLGTISDLDRVDRKADWFAAHEKNELTDGWLDDLVPVGIADTDAGRAQLQAAAKERYELAMLREERRGTSGMEAAFNDALMGRLGLRLVEHDSKRREQLLWSHLRVESGDDVTITIDLDAQAVAERVVRAAHARMSALFDEEKDQNRVQAALAVIDALTGDVLAYAGAPIRGNGPRGVPGVFWSGIGYIGSVVKPFVLVEQLQSQACGRPHVALAEIEPCSGSLRYAGTTIRCGHAHWEAGSDPVDALAESCNLFFYQSAIGLGDDGLARALRRFGLMRPADANDPFASSWQAVVRGLPIADAAVEVGTLLPRRGIGYGVSASSLAVARAYAGLATGALPTLGLLRGETRPTVHLGDLATELIVVRDGLRQCVESGTARRIESLRALGVCGKTGTAEVGTQKQNNAWFAGYLPVAGSAGVQLCCCAVVYWVPDNVHGGDAAGQVVADFLQGLLDDTVLRARYLHAESGR